MKSCSLLRASFVLVATIFFFGGGAVHAQSCAEDLSGDGVVNGFDLGMILAAWGSCPGTVDSVVPSQGGYLGGTLITITGTNLSTTTAVSIGGSSCTNLQVLSPTVVKAVTPAGAVGYAAIEITTAAGSFLTPLPFNFMQSAISSIGPNTGIYWGGTAITITGSYLNGATGVTIGGVPATSVVSVSSTTVTAITPAGSVGSADVAVQCPKGPVTVADGFTYSAATVPSWATLLQGAPDPGVVTNAALRAAIIATGLPWRVRDNSSNIEMLLIPPGVFTMGCSASTSSDCVSNENPTHQVTLTNAFYLGKTEVTQAQWLVEMGSNPSMFVGYADSPSRPVERVSWNTIQPFLTQNGLRLPTEAEWEYAYRAGTTTAFHSFTGYPNGTNTDSLLGSIAWYDSNSGIQTHAVAGKFANGYGLYDMSGNVLEWCKDWFGAYSASPATNPTGPASGPGRLLRGGENNQGSGSCRASYRAQYGPDNAPAAFGFRVARTP